MQYDRAEDGTLTPLPKQNIDTGMGLERVAAIMQGVHSNFETDIVRGIMEVAEDITGAKYGDSEKTDTSLRIIADHARAVTFLISDGVLPSNEGRGYVLRRILRRAVRHGRLLGVEKPFLGRLVDEVVTRMGDAYPEIHEHHDLVSRIVVSEEERFGTTLRQGLIFLAEAIERAQAEGSAVLDGKLAFALHDTYGFPYELTAEIAAEAGLEADQAIFEVEMTAQRDRARAAVKDDSWSAFGNAFAVVSKQLQGGVEFVGYSKNEIDSTVVGIIANGEAVNQIDAGVQADIVLAVTPFYGEQGGQVGDAGTISADGMLFEVSATRIPMSGLISHVGALQTGTLSVGDSVHAAIDIPRRERIRRNHTATHILHWALRKVLGEHVHQSGSLVTPDRLRFDFTHFEAPGAEQLERVERLVNAKIMENHPVRNYETSLASAREMGVTALFGEKYGDIVRVLEVGNFSKELCGGTHVGRSSEIGFVKITSEGSVGANLRRIEAVTSFGALDHIYAEEAMLSGLAGMLRCRPAEVLVKVDALQRRLKETEAVLAEAKRRGGSGELDALVTTAVDVGYPLVVARVEISDGAAIREIADTVRAKLSGGAVVLAAEVSGTALLLAAGSAAAVAAGFDAGAVIREIAPRVGGGGGGKPTMAQAGGKDASGIDAALDAARVLLGVR